jgi:adenylyl-sulfate kinase
VRESLSRGLGFSREDREENVRRIGYVAKLLARNGVIAICAAVSPYRSTRDEVRRNTVQFVEVYVECPVDVCERRDTEGMYARARRGELRDFTGVDGPYEPPTAPEVHVNTATESIDQGAWKVIRALEMLGVVSVGESERQEEDTATLIRRLASEGKL